MDVKIIKTGEIIRRQGLSMTSSRLTATLFWKVI